jgi:hypothetical protein
MANKTTIFSSVSSCSVLIAAILLITFLVIIPAVNKSKTTTTIEPTTSSYGMYQNTAYTPVSLQSFSTVPINTQPPAPAAPVAMTQVPITTTTFPPATTNVVAPTTTPAPPVCNYTDADGNVSVACMAKTWKDVGCSSAPDFQNSWWSKQTYGTIKSDMAAYPNSTDYNNRKVCYGSQGDSCKDTPDDAVGVSDACLADAWKGVGCSTSMEFNKPYWKTVPFKNAKADMLAYSLLTGEGRKACYGA